MKAPKAPKAPKVSLGERKLHWQLHVATKFHVETQYPFHPTRKFRADFAIWPTAEKGCPPLLVEVNGAKYGKPGAHQRVDGLDRDYRRAAEALKLGMQMISVSYRMVQDGTALATIEELLGVSG